MDRSILRFLLSTDDSCDDAHEFLSDDLTALDLDCDDLDDDVFVLNNILNLRNKPGIEETKPNGDVIRAGRYETRAFETARKIFKRAGVQV